MNTCQGKTKSGAPCTRAAGDYGYCYQHDPLTDLQRAFIDEYLVDLNGAAAARRAGYSAASARSIASENLTKPDIRAAIDARLKLRAMSADEAIARLTEMARGSVGAFVRVKEGKATLDISSAGAPLHLIRKLKITERHLGEDLREVKTEIELHDAKDALVQILKLHGAFAAEKVEHSGPDGGPISHDHGVHYKLGDEEALEIARILHDVGALKPGGREPAQGAHDTEE